MHTPAHGLQTKGGKVPDVVVSDAALTSVAVGARRRIVKTTTKTTTTTSGHPAVSGAPASCR